MQKMTHCFSLSSFHLGFIFTYLYWTSDSMLGIGDINLDIKIQRRISKQHSTILGTAGKKLGDIYL